MMKSSDATVPLTVPWYKGENEEGLGEHGGLMGGRENCTAGRAEGNGLYNTCYM